MQKSGVQEKSFSFAAAIVALCDGLRQNRDFVLSDPLLRAGTSIGANVEEAQAAQSKRDFIAKMCIASKEARESRYWLRLLVATGKLDSDIARPVIQTNEELIRMLTSIIKTSQERLSANGGRTSEDTHPPYGPTDSPSTHPFSTQHSTLNTALRAFTLVEILIVITVLAILMAIGLTVAETSAEKAKRAAVLGTLGKLYMALESYKNEFGYYPYVQADHYISKPISGDTRIRILDSRFRRFFTVNTDNLGDDDALLDPWGNPYIYQMTDNINSHCKVYFDGDSAPTMLRNLYMLSQTSKPIHDTIFIYSLGPDGEFDTGTDNETTEHYWPNAPEVAKMHENNPNADNLYYTKGVK